MKKVSFACVLILVFTVEKAQAQPYLYKVAPAGGKNFITAVGIPPGSTISLDIYLTGVTAPQNAGDADLGYSGSLADISIVSAGRCMLDGSEGCIGPWTTGAGVNFPNPAGPGTHMMIVANLGGAAPDSDGDLIVGTYTLQNTGPNDATVDFGTLWSWGSWTPIDPMDVVNGQIVISQILDDEDEDGIQDSQDNCPNMPNGPLLGTCINIYNGVVGTTCLNDGGCGTGDDCSNDQEDRDNNGAGDACDTVTFCRGLADFDKDVDATDVTVFLSHFGRSQYFNPCPPDGPSPVPKTGQTTSYATGDDGDLERGVALVMPRFTENGDGTVTDNQTGLIWLRDANCFDRRTWDNALSDCNGLADGSCGLTDGSKAGDWRLPNRFELESLLDLKNHSPCLPTGHPFTNIQSSYYLSSTTYAYDATYAWLVHMPSGYVEMNDKSAGSFYFWPVRGGH